MSKISKWRNAYVHFVEKQGFSIIVTVCVAVITVTALWTGQHQDTWSAPTPPPYQDLAAAQLIQQSLRDSATPAPTATPAPKTWSAPLEAYTVLQPFSEETMVYSGVTGIWAIHAAVDLAAEAGSLIRSMADGTVLSAGKDALQGTWLRIDHGDGIEAVYAGMALTADYRAGDAVRQGDVIGYCGNGLLAESDLQPHLHLQVYSNGATIDPCSLWQQ